MMKKEKIIDTFRELGFLLEEIEDREWYSFSYEGNNYLYLYNSEDEEFLSISIPGIFDLKEDNANAFVSLEEMLNSTPKYVKAYKMGNSLWLFYERELLGDEDLKLVVSRMIMHLDAALFTAYKIMSKMETEEEDTIENDEQPEDAVVINEIEAQDSPADKQEQNSEEKPLESFLDIVSGLMKRDSTDTETKD